MNRKTFYMLRPLECLSSAQPVCGSDMPRLRPQPPPQRHPEGIATMRELNRQNKMTMREKSPMSSRGQSVKLPPILGSSQPTAKPVQQSLEQQKRKERFRPAEWLAALEEKQKLLMNQSTGRKPIPPSPPPKKGQWNEYPLIISEESINQVNADLQRLRDECDILIRETSSRDQYEDEVEIVEANMNGKKPWHVRHAVFGSTQPRGLYTHPQDEVKRRLSNCAKRKLMSPTFPSSCEKIHMPQPKLSEKSTRASIKLRGQCPEPRYGVKADQRRAELEQQKRKEWKIESPFDFSKPHNYVAESLAAKEESTGRKPMPPRGKSTRPPIEFAFGSTQDRGLYPHPQYDIMGRTHVCAKCLPWPRH